MALLRPTKVIAEVPGSLHASAHRIASNTDAVNSASKKMVICDEALRIKMFRSGFLVTNKDEKGCSTELSKAKKTVKAKHTVVVHKTTQVIKHLPLYEDPESAIVPYLKRAVRLKHGP